MHASVTAKSYDTLLHLCIFCVPCLAAQEAWLSPQAPSLGSVSFHSVWGLWWIKGPRRYLRKLAFLPSSCDCQCLPGHNSSPGPNRWRCGFLKSLAAGIRLLGSGKRASPDHELREALASHERWSLLHVLSSRQPPSPMARVDRLI